MSNKKMKGLLKGLRYISQIFDNEKEPEMQIGFPTDVKHVAHIGWDGPSVNTPSWMNEFQTPPGFSTPPVNLTGDGKEDNSAKRASGDSTTSPNVDSTPSPNVESTPSPKDVDSTRRGSRPPNSLARDLPDLPKSSRRHSSTGAVTQSPTREKSTRQSKKSSKNPKDSPDGSKPTQQPVDSNPESESPSNSKHPPDIPRKSRKKVSTGEGSSSTRSSRLKPQVVETYQSPFSDPGPASGSASNNNEIYPQPFQGEEKGFTAIS